MINQLLDTDFLKQIDEWQQKEVYAKIISLDFNENPRSEIQGYVTGGSINVDGSSAVRRTCSLSLIAQNQSVNEFEWTLNTKFRLSIGLKNFIDNIHDDIIWFPQGTYVITSFNSSSTTSGFSISLQGKDKMCLLDGSVGGNIFAAHDFGKIEVIHDDGSTEMEPILIYDIIRNAIHEYALEPYENIIINDLEDCSVELLMYRAKNKSLIVYNSYNLEDKTGHYDSNIAFQGNQILKQFAEAAKKAPLEQGNYAEQEAEINKILSQVPENVLLITDEGKKIQYRLVKYVSYGDTIGYRLTDLTYPLGQDLILGAGSTITQLLDALVKLLGDFEYYYDLQGRFVFQRKKIYYNVSWNNAVTHERETYYDSIENGSANAYTFTKGILIESYNNKPNLTNIKNDFTIWGNRVGIKGDLLPAHLRCAIDKKPLYYKPLLDENGKELEEDERSIWASKDDIILTEAGKEAIIEHDGAIVLINYACDWRELIYKMAYDYSKSDAKILEYEKLIAIETDREKLKQYKTKLTDWKKTYNINYIAYYTDLLDFWRLLYNPYKQDGWETNGYWNPEYISYMLNSDTNKYEIHIINHTTIPFWLDFCEDSYLDKYSVQVIGRRTKVVNDTEIKAIFFEETPNLLFIDPTATVLETDTNLGYARLNISGGMANYFQISTQGKSAKEVLDSLLYTHTYYNDSVTISCIPIYYLEPNTRIAIHDEQSGINGEYLIKSYSLQLAYNGSMSITATRAEKLIL